MMLCIGLLTLVGDAVPSAAQAGDAGSLIAEVNAFRAANGLPPFEVDYALMAAAQAHSEYMAKNGTITHSGAGGSSARDRAVAAGYGDGAAVLVIENIAGGNNLSPSQAVYSMWQDALHRETMLTSYYVHIGAGVATSGSFVYYTIDVGRIQGAPPPPTATLDPAATPAPASTPLPANTPEPTKVAAQPVVVATPREDGSIVHVVQAGQALYTIAVVYDVSLEAILAINGLTMDSVIYPGDEIIIQAGLSPGPSPSPSPTELLATLTDANAGADEVSALSPALRKSEDYASATPTLELLAAVQQSEELAEVQPETTSINQLDEPDAVAQSKEDSSEGGGVDILFVVIFFFVLIGVAMVVFGSFLRRGSGSDSGPSPSQEP
jgi:LysM repeat protein